MTELMFVYGGPDAGPIAEEKLFASELLKTLCERCNRGKRDKV